MAAVLTFSLALFCTTGNQVWVCVSGRCSGQSLLFTLPACSINDTPRTLLPELCTPLHLSCTSCAASANRFIFWQSNISKNRFTLLHVPERRAGVALQQRFNMALTASHHPTCGHVRWVGDVHRFDFSSQTPSRTTAIFVDVQAPAPWAAVFSQPWPCWHTAPRSKTANAANNR